MSISEINEIPRQSGSIHDLTFTLHLVKITSSGVKIYTIKSLGHLRRNLHKLVWQQRGWRGSNSWLGADSMKTIGLN